ncbi:MAG: iron-containing alcohol dehydrogenase [Defluviitaleaceae bacterium]|nr:iron-containing alcohol dehydrogenase [Defluviitaleaceae bacterium]
MKALILNSGVGSRMKNLANCKCLVELADGLTIFDAQIQALLRCGVEDIYITTGSNADILTAYAHKHYPKVQFTFIHNPLFNKTNYIYSIHLTRKLICDDDVLLLHGDLVFEENVLQDILTFNHSAMIIDSTMPLPEKDFKASIKDGRIITIGIDVFEDAVYAQPLYKLKSQEWNKWLDEIDSYCHLGMTNVYAENAFNNVSKKINLFPLDILGRQCFEVDNQDDLVFAKEVFAKLPDRKQQVFSGYNASHFIKNITYDKKIFIVRDDGVKDIMPDFGPDKVFFGDFKPNPSLSEVSKGIDLFKKENCNFIVSFGGGSAIDVAKCISILDKDELLPSPRAKHLAIPTTAGTGSESTCFAVAYKEGEKISVEHERILPEYVVLDAKFLETLPDYHKKSSFLDAFCQAIESLWAKGQTPESRAYALSAIRIIQENTEGYFNNEPRCAARIQLASNLAGKAINISKTTAAHAMSYSLSTNFGLAHGHAVALCFPYVWEHLKKKKFATEHESLIKTISKICIPYDFGLVDDKMVEMLASSVNVQRLSNHPVVISKDELTSIYHEILRFK